ncbi:MAG: sugar-binding transcriptional regulator [Anaerolineae bacterium]|nr:sugar-binding transcriptional regulator [Anaerolineae bacterium]
MKNSISDEQLQQLAEVAHLYYERGLDQAEIASQLKVSRASISRLLMEARELGVIEFRINFPLRRDSALEAKLRERFGLTSVHVLNTQNIAESHVLQRLGRLAALYLLQIIADNMTIGVTWGTSVYEVVTALPRQQLQNTRVVQVIGASGTSDPLIDGTDIARQFAERIRGQHFYLHSPLVVESTQVRDAILTDPSISNTLGAAREAELLITGIGTLNPRFSAHIRAGYLTEQYLNVLKSNGAVGEFCGYYIDKDGQLSQTPYNARVVGISLDDIRNIANVLGVAAGTAKAPSTLAALRGKLINMLVIDDCLATEVLHLDDHGAQSP